MATNFPETPQEILAALVRIHQYQVEWLPSVVLMYRNEEIARLVRSEATQFYLYGDRDLPMVRLIEFLLTVVEGKSDVADVLLDESDYLRFLLIDEFVDRTKELFVEGTKPFLEK